MAQDVEYAIKLQELDNQIVALKREIAALPRHIAEIEEALVSHQRRLEADEAALNANLKERRRLESGVQDSEEKISKLKNQMLGARTNDQYRAFQHEISFCEQEIRQSEDRILDLMGESETLEENVNKAKAALAEEKQQVDREAQAARERTAADQKRLEELGEQRKQIVAAMTPKVYAAYEHARKKFHGTALAEGVNGRCMACNIAMRPQLFQDLKSGKELLVCENCGRLLYYKPPVEPEP